MNNTEIFTNTLLESFAWIVKTNMEEETFEFVKWGDPDVPLNTTVSLQEYLEIFQKQYDIHPEDLYRFRKGISKKILRQKCEQKQSGTLFSYRIFTGLRYEWIKLAMLIPKDFGPEQPHVLLYGEQLSVDSSDLAETMSAYSRKIVKVVKCNLSNRTYRIVKQRESEEFIHRKNEKEYVLSEAWLSEEGLVHPQDLSYFVQYVDNTMVEDYFNDGNEELTFFYRRRVGSSYHWVRASVNKSIEYTQNNHIYTYIIEDIDEVLMNLLENKSVPGLWEEMTREAHRSDRYDTNLRQILSYYTQHFVDFYLIDLKNDFYIMYKIKPENVNGKLPYSGSYTQTFLPYMREKVAEQMAEKNIRINTIESLTAQLSDKTSIEMRSVNRKGEMFRSVYTKIASEFGVPTKVLCYVLPVSDENRLKVTTFGNFEVFDHKGERVKFTRKQSKQLLAYLIDRQGFPASTREIAVDVLEKPEDDLNAIKYVSTLAKAAIKDLEKAGYKNIIIKEWNSLRVDTKQLDCDYYHLLNGDVTYLHKYHNEYMKEYSWAEETNSEILHYSSR